MIQILPLPTFKPPMGPHQIIMDHNGGTWKLQQQTPEGNWIDTGKQFNADGVVEFNAPQGGIYRLNGGTDGAKAWMSRIAT